MVPKGGPETPVINHDYGLRKIPKESRSHLHRSGSPKSNKNYLFEHIFFQMANLTALNPFLPNTGVGKSRFTVVSTRNTEYILVLLLFIYLFIMLLYICIICLLIITVISKAITIIVNCMSFSIRKTVNLLLPTPVNFYLIIITISEHGDQDLILKCINIKTLCSTAQ
jgi:hypothetical protein